ncbi:DUF423 domain-containing protein [Lysobacter sp. N42]|nr:DUF423 domain-containing protein [Aliidiomarina sp. B3213]TCZ93450.1 DUF423 domain-containing protein [Lysobacter sp. N42]
MFKSFLALGAIFLGLAVILGAFGAHALKNQVAESSIATWQTAVLYQVIHAFGLVVIAFMFYHVPQAKFLFAIGTLFVLGILMFSGSLYGLVLTQWKFLGPITPLGGLCFIAGWSLLAWSALKLPA